MWRRSPVVLLFVGMVMSASILVVAWTLSVEQLKIELLNRGEDFTAPSWSTYYSPDLVQDGVRAWTVCTSVTGSGFGPCNPTFYLPGSNRSGLVRETYVYQQAALPNGVSSYNFNLYSNGIGEMAGVGNGFAVSLCSPSQRCEGTAEQVIRFELFRCVPGDVRCAIIGNSPTEGWVARLILSSGYGQNVRTDMTEVENLTKTSVVSVHVLLYGYSRSYSEGRTYGASAAAILEVSYRFKDQIFNNWVVGSLVHYLNLYNVAYEPSKLNGIKIAFSSSCITCNNTLSSYANIDHASYTAIAPTLNILHLDTFPGNILLYGIAASPTAGTGVKALYVWRRRTR